MPCNVTLRYQIRGYAVTVHASLADMVRRNGGVKCKALWYTCADMAI